MACYHKFREYLNLEKIDLGQKTTMPNGSMGEPQITISGMSCPEYIILL
jgi:hypothetical protein